MATTMPVPTVYVGIGVPGSGKTRHLEPFAKEIGAAYICPDKIREEWTGDANCQAQNESVWDEARCRAARALRKGQSIVIDATNANPEYRKELIQFCLSLQPHAVVGIWLQTPLEVCLDRNARRERVVPDQVILDMHAALKQSPPSLEEGFTTIWLVGTS